LLWRELKLILEIQHMARAGVVIQLGHPHIPSSASIAQVVDFLCAEAAYRAIQLRSVGRWSRLERLNRRCNVLAVIGRLCCEPIVQRGCYRRVTGSVAKLRAGGQFGVHGRDTRVAGLELRHPRHILAMNRCRIREVTAASRLIIPKLLII
jgi:hypothetical protein